MVFNCDKCNKTYKSYQSLWNHNNKFHTNKNDIVKQMSNNLSNNVKQMSNEKLICIKCNKQFNNRQAKWIHNKKCNVDTDIQKENNILKEEVEKIKKEKEELTLNMEKIFNKQLENMKKHFTELINKNCKIHPKTLTKINKQLNIVNDNKIINNNIIIQFGRERLYEVFSKKEKLDVLNHGFKCLENLIEYTHFNHKYPQFKNILITNLQNNLAYKYNANTNNFDVITKNELLEEIVSERM
jgi:hypothetical protein